MSLWKEIPPALAAITSRCCVIEWIVKTAAMRAAIGNDQEMNSGNWYRYAQATSFVVRPRSK